MFCVLLLLIFYSRINFFVLAVDIGERDGDGIWWCGALYSTIHTDQVKTDNSGIFSVRLSGTSHGEHFEDHFLVWKSFWDSLISPEHTHDPHHVRLDPPVRLRQHKGVFSGREEERAYIYWLWPWPLLAVDRLHLLCRVCYVRCCYGWGISEMFLKSSH